MPYVVCEVTSKKEEEHTSEGDANGPGGTYYTLEIQAEIADENVRTWGRQLYALVGMFYLPVLIDGLWFLRAGGDVRRVVDGERGAASRDGDCEAAAPSLTDEESQVVASFDWTDGETPPQYAILSLAMSEVREVFKERSSEVREALLALRERDALAFLSRLKRYGKAHLALRDGSVVEILPNMVKPAVDEPAVDELADGTREKKRLEPGEIITAVVCSPLLIFASAGYPIMMGMSYGFGFAMIMINSALILARNLVFALIPYALMRRWWCNYFINTNHVMQRRVNGCNYFINNNLIIQKSVNDDGKEAWELLTTLTYGMEDHASFTCDRARSRDDLDNLRPGDTIKVGFGPFEHWCLFRN